MKILLIVDMQNDFCPGGALAVEGGHEIVDTINALMHSGEFDCVIATKDWHPFDHVSFADNHPGATVGDIIQTASGPQIVWARHCVQGSYGAEFHPDLDQSRIAHVVTKGEDPKVDSYSGFFDNAREHETPLRAIIERMALERGEHLADVEVCVCGLALDFCVDATARDAASLGLKTTVLIDACRAVDPSPHKTVELSRRLITSGVSVSTASDILAMNARKCAQQLPRERARDLPC